MNGWTNGDQAGIQSELNEDEDEDEDDDDDDDGEADVGDGPGADSREVVATRSQLPLLGKQPRAAIVSRSHLDTWIGRPLPIATSFSLLSSSISYLTPLRITTTAQICSALSATRSAP